ncbi:MAG: mechanosensitive ion channel family protein [Acidimicrobiales bacterium]
MLIPDHLSVAGAILAQAPSRAETAACGVDESAKAVCRAVFRATDNTFVAQASDAVIVRPAKIAVILIGALIAQRLLRRAVTRLAAAMRGEVERHAGAHGGDRNPPALLGSAQSSLRRSQRAETMAALLRSVSSVAVWSVAVLMVLSEIGLDLGPLIAGAGIVGVAVGFGSQYLVRDLVTGIFMLVEDQYGVGDIVDLGSATGRVEGVSLRTTRLRDVSGTVWYVPNGQIDRVGNTSQQWSRAVLDIAVAYETDIPHATSVMKQAADELWAERLEDGDILEEPEVWGVEDLGADGVALRLVVKTAPERHLAVARELRARIKGAFDRAGIEIPYPQRTVHVTTGAALGAD